MIKLLHFIGIIFRYIFGQMLFCIGRYDKKWRNCSYFRGLLSEGWNWLYHDWRSCFVAGVNSTVPWPVSSFNKVVGWENIEFAPEDLHIFQGKGCYFQGQGKIIIGQGTFIANNVGIITSNHDTTDPRKHVESKPVIIGEHCWIGMNSMILPGVQLGPHTTVGAGAIVTHSFPNGYCIIAGNPARIIKSIRTE